MRCLRLPINGEVRVDFPLANVRGGWHPRGMSKFLIPILIIGFGVMWLLDALDVRIPVGLAWTCVLFAIGVAVLVGTGFNKDGFPWGMFFLAAGVCSILRQSGQLSVHVELPLLVILLGVLLAINQTRLIPARSVPTPPPLPRE